MAKAETELVKVEICGERYPLIIYGQNTGKWKICKKRAGYGTTHPGRGHCFKHGGRSRVGLVKFLTSKLTDKDEADIAEIVADGDALFSLEQEVAVLKVMIRREVGDEENTDPERVATLIDTLSRVQQRAHVIRRDLGKLIPEDKVTDALIAIYELATKYIEEKKLTRFGNDVNLIIMSKFPSVIRTNSIIDSSVSDVR